MQGSGLSYFLKRINHVSDLAFIHIEFHINIPHFF
uniref:Uncharacterized protein n=1 Tax=Arundo donax TaxID=35708 RepID=A0A0A9BTQ3_ARUDO